MARLHIKEQTALYDDWPSCWVSILEMTIEDLRNCQQVCTAVAAAMAKTPENPIFLREHGVSLRNLAHIIELITTLEDCAPQKAGECEPTTQAPIAYTEVGPVLVDLASADAEDCTVHNPS